jgi:hypothetical protein
MNTRTTIALAVVLAVQHGGLRLLNLEYSPLFHLLDVDP